MVKSTTCTAHFAFIVHFGGLLIVITPGTAFTNIFTFIPVWLSNCELKLPIQDNGGIDEVWELVNNFIPHFIEHVINIHAVYNANPS